ncbi:hypothetical protein [Synechococcus elongatus]|uniref:Uncharacterized protein n=1 Tax=Synechococcus elongatus PCC 11802 TaxID=2283154 RepID=A0AAT9K0E2_SYNEL|nr:hypothetical protein [Synechococcus elongatus]QFZ91110.1 hypothetical protein EKO22_00790 [Synechococcus elongatus PCC 11802]
MTTQFLSVLLPWQSDLQQLIAAIETALSQHGQPLRWAIAAREGAMVRVEAVVTPCLGDR